MVIQLLDTATPSPLHRLVDDYLSSCMARGLAPRSVNKSYGYSLYAIFLPWCRDEGIETLAQLDRRAIDRFSATLYARRKEDGEPLSRYSIHAYIRPVRQLLSWAAEVGEEVIAKPQLPRRERPLRDVLTREEVDLLESALPSERDRLIIRIFADCGLRLDELTKLEPKDIVRSGRMAYLRVLGKRSRVRDVPLMPMLLRRLERHIERRPVDRTEDRIFLARKRAVSGGYEPLTESGVYKVVRDAIERARIPKRVFPHLLRHTWMTEMLRSGMNPIQLSLIAGASPDVIAQCYTHLTKDDAYEAMMSVLSRSRK